MLTVTHNYLQGPNAGTSRVACSGSVVPNNNNNNNNQAVIDRRLRPGVATRGATLSTRHILDATYAGTLRTSMMS